MAGHILIVEDDENIAHMIAATLDIGGYTSEVSADGDLALSALASGSYDLVLLDIMLPKLDGFSVFERKGTNNTPVIFLTAMGDVPTKVKGLRMGAEDYIVKPFEAVELLARIEVVLRRTQNGNTPLSYQNITVEVDKHLVLRNSRPVTLTPKEFDLLAFFIRNVDIALTRERLLSAVWGYDFAGETRTVDTHVQQLRKKLDLHDSLVTIPRLGYRLESQRSDQSN
ncbi:MAG: response regulator transcription factor [Coriobacteriales bacterium]|jgi:DNA-binding response OmpR family regulator|nr:response regulator transcription factor [Coriobacteriales bacterium]